MKLSDANILHKYVNGEEATTIKEFIDHLLCAKNIVADVYADNKLLFTAATHFIVDNGYMVASVDKNFAVNKDVSFNTLSVQLRYANDPKDVEHILMESYTETFIALDTHDCDADLYFKVINLAPNCTKKCFVPNSTFALLKSDKQHKVDLNAPDSDPINSPSVTLLSTDII